ncbi:MAG TPA: cell wall-binding protein, partial [Lachnoclostridium sp.]|nr:cell wall-binding protein [Lachnoclostridium sp.]
MQYRKKMTALLIAGLVGTSTLIPAGTAWGATGWVSEGTQWKYIDQDGSTHKGWVKT